ncbi:MAG TPA: GntR family transcriptional regulator [Streptosporangiaceae bacterium]|jgi:DNA-binding GntR family transcriptional regulator
MPLPQTAGPVARISARETAYEHVRDWITLGPLEPGEPIRDVEIAALLGISRTPVREALLKLAQEGLVETVPGYQTRVAPLRFDRVPHLFAIGGVLDALAAEEAAPDMDAEACAEMERLLARMTQISDPRELQLLDEQFHGVYYVVAGNAPLLKLLEDVSLELRRFDREGFRSPEIMLAANDEHRAILEALRRRDGTTAAAAARTNWNRSWDRIAEARMAGGEATAGSSAQEGDR